MPPSDQTFWIDSPSDLQLQAGTIHLWRCPEEIAATKLDDLSRSLNAQEQRRAQQYRFEPDRRRFILCRGVLRDLLGRYLDCPPDQVRFTSGAHGKPALATEHQAGSLLDFNLSHTRGMCLLGFTHGRAIGVDVESVEPNRDWEPMARRFLHPNEWQRILTLPVARRASSFHSCWTCKEAYLKGRGEGLTRGPGSFEVILPQDSEPPQIVDDSANPDENWWLRELSVGPGFAAACASAVRPITTAYFQYGGS
jgi:4'-phosphopantetheinyl transferase